MKDVEITVDEGQLVAMSQPIDGGAPITVKIVKDSITDGGSRLITWCWEYQRMIHAEIMTHRALSRNAASSRAIPAAKLRERVITAPAVPVHFGKNEKGMQASSEVEDRDTAYAWWIAGRNLMAEHHKNGEALGLHKQIVNRVIEPWMTIAVVVSMTDHANLFHLRKHAAAEPNFQVIASLAWELFHNHMPTYVPIGGWHLPYVDESEIELITDGSTCTCDARGWMDRCTAHDKFPSPQAKKISTARCARVSYLTHEGKRDIAADIELHDRLAATASMGADPMHACYDAGTEVLTRDGWKLWSEIKEYDQLAAVSVADHSIDFERPQRLVADPFDGVLYSVRGQQLDLCVTPNHRMVVGFRRGDGGWSDFDLVAAETLGDRSCRYLKSGFLRGRLVWENPWGVDAQTWARFIGFFVGDGHAPAAGGNQAQFHLRKERKREFVRGLDLPWRKLDHGGLVVELPGLGHWLRANCYTSSGAKRFPDDVLTITYAEANALFDGLHNSDGSARRKTWVYSTSSYAVRDSLQALLHLNNLVGSITTTRGEQNRADSFRINVSRRTTPRVEITQEGRSLSYEIGQVPYKGLVYCAEVSTGALLVRRNNHVAVCGNSPFEHPAKAVGGRARFGNFEGWRQYRKEFPHEAGPDTSARCEGCGCWGGRHVVGCPDGVGERK